jgi:UDP-N-acetylglucosamine/UDP-N-acetylgalactosamine 4-epimerase
MYAQAFHKEDLSKFTFLVTGGAGFIGSNIVEYLLKYNAGKVRVLDNLATGFEQNLNAFIKHKNFEFQQGDICSIADCHKAMEGVHYVFHQAALGSVPRSIENPIATNNANVNGFLNILIAARDAKVNRLVYASSSSVYGDSQALPKMEEKIGKPLSPYAVSKLVNEQYADIFAKTYGMEIVGLRYFNIFGPRQNPKGAYAAAIPLFMDAILKNTSPFINGDGEQTRDFTFVENAVQANIKAMFAIDKSVSPDVFNIAVGERVSVNQLYEILRKIAGSNVYPTHRAERAGDVRNSLADISKAEKKLNFTPTVKCEEGLKITFDWFKNNM